MYVPEKRKAGPVEKEITIADPKNPVELYDYLALLGELNTQKVKAAGEFIYKVSEIIRHDALYGDYTVTVITELGGEGGESKQIMYITCYDEAGRPLLNLDNKQAQRINRQLRAKGLENFAKKRGLKLEAARTHRYKPRFVEDEKPAKTADLKELANASKEA